MPARRRPFSLEFFARPDQKQHGWKHFQSEHDGFSLLAIFLTEVFVVGRRRRAASACSILQMSAAPPPDHSSQSSIGMLLLAAPRAFGSCVLVRLVSMCALGCAV